MLLQKLASSFCIAMLIAFNAPSLAFADEPSSDGATEIPAVHIAPEDAGNQEYVEHDSQFIGDVLVSANEQEALIEGESFGLIDFNRAAAGSNKSIDGTYYGYNYYVGKEKMNLCCVVIDGELAVVHVAKEVLDEFSLNLDNESDENLIKNYLIALDNVNAKGSGRLEAVGDFHFTDSPEYVTQGIKFSFGKEIKDGQFYICVIGEDGSDITAASNPNVAKVSFADFAKIVPADDVNIEVAPTGLAWLMSFLAQIDLSPLFVTLKTTLTAIVIIFVLGLAAAYLTMRTSKRVQDILDTIFTIPMVLPPTVCGFILLLACGSNTAFGRFFIDIGFPLIFSWPATVIAAVVVAFPLMYRNSRGAFENLDPNMLDAARTLGWSDIKIFFRLMLPLSWSSIAAATVLAFARALGEFGATLFLAGNYVGITRTIPIAIWFQWTNGNVDEAIFWTIVVIIFSFIVILFINLWSRHQTKYRRGAIDE